MVAIAAGKHFIPIIAQLDYSATATFGAFPLRHILESQIEQKCRPTTCGYKREAA
jgi:hypothetical protein